MAFAHLTNQQTRRSVLRGIAIGTTSIAGLAAASSTVTAQTGYPQSEDDSEYDWEVFTVDEIGQIELRVHERFVEFGPDLLRITRWAQEIAQEYRPLDYTGLCRIWLYPPDGEAMESEIGFSSGGLASGVWDTMDIYMTHPPGYVIEDILSASDPRLEHEFFRTLMHEYIHAESYWMMPRLPGWFEHGFTEYTTKNHHVSYYQTVRDHVENGELMSLEEVEETTGGYTYGLFVMKYLVQEHGIEAVGDIYDELAANYARDKNLRTEESFETVLGIPFDEFEAGFREAVRSWFSVIDSIPDAIDYRIIHPDDYFTRERGEVGIDIGSPPNVDYEPTAVDTDAEEEPSDEDEETEALEERLIEKREDLSDAEEALERKKDEVGELEIDLERKRETIEEYEERVAELEQQLEDERRRTETPESSERHSEGSADRKDRAAWGAGGVIGGGGVVYLASKHSDWFGQILNR